MLHSACVGVQPVCASLTSLHLLLSCIYPCTHSFINSAIHSSLHPSIQTSIHLLRPLTHFTYKCLWWWECVHVRKRERWQNTHNDEKVWECMIKESRSILSSGLWVSMPMKMILLLFKGRKFKTKSRFNFLFQDVLSSECTNAETIIKIITDRTKVHNKNAVHYWCSPENIYNGRFNYNLFTICTIFNNLSKHCYQLLIQTRTYLNWSDGRTQLAAECPPTTLGQSTISTYTDGTECRWYTQSRAQSEMTVGQYDTHIQVNLVLE